MYSFIKFKLKSNAADIEDLKQQRHQVQQLITQDRSRQQNLEREIRKLHEQLQSVNSQLEVRVQLHSDIEEALAQAEDAFDKVHCTLCRVCTLSIIM